MGSWHDCDSRCSRLHAAFFAKFVALVTEARTPPRKLPLPLHRDESFNLPTLARDIGSGGEGELWMRPLELNVVLEAKSGGSSHGQNHDHGHDYNQDRDHDYVLFLETSRGGNESMQRVPTDVGRQGVVLETWRIHFDNTGSFIDTSGTTTLDEFIANAVMILRSLYSLARTLPAFRLLTRAGMSVGIVRGGVGKMIGLDQSILGEGGAFEPTSQVRLVPVKTPHGFFHVDIRYRRNCSFVLSEASVQKTISKGASFESVALAVPWEGPSAATCIRTPSTGASLPKPAVPILLSHSPRHYSSSPSDSLPTPKAGMNLSIRRSSSPAIPHSLAESPLATTTTTTTTGSTSRRSGSLSSRTGTSLKEDSELLAFFEWIQRPLPQDFGGTFRKGFLTRGEELAQKRREILGDHRPTSMTLTSAPPPATVITTTPITLTSTAATTTPLSPIEDVEHEEPKDTPEVQSDSVLFEISHDDP